MAPNPGSLFKEIYGYWPGHAAFKAARPWIEPHHDDATDRPRSGGVCPYKATYLPAEKAGCSKSTIEWEDGRRHPTATCILQGTQSKLGVVCPDRLKTRQVLSEMGERMFSLRTGDQQTVLSEVRLQNADGTPAGNLDLVLVHSRDGRVLEFGGVEVQTVYFSGAKVSDIYREFLSSLAADENTLPPVGSRTLDWRSSSKKRLLPQLIEKGNIFHHWGRPFGVLMQDNYFESLPEIPSENNGNFHLFSYSLIPNNSIGRFDLNLHTHIRTAYGNLISKLTTLDLPEKELFLEEIEERVEGAPDHATTTRGQ